MRGEENIMHVTCIFLRMINEYWVPSCFLLLLFKQCWTWLRCRTCCVSIQKESKNRSMSCSSGSSRIVLKFFTKPECTLCDRAMFILNKIRVCHSGSGSWSINSDLITPPIFLCLLTYRVSMYVATTSLSPADCGYFKDWKPALDGQVPVWDTCDPCWWSRSV